MRKYKRLITILVILVCPMLFISTGFVTNIYAQVALQCGSTLEAEISISEADEGHFYTVSLNAGDRITISATAIGDGFDGVLTLYGTDGSRVTSDDDSGGGYNPLISNFAAPSTGTYTMSLREYQGEVGAYRLGISCTLRTGETIDQGDEQNDVAPTPQPTEPQFSGIGFPGLPPVDFSAINRTTIDFGEPEDAEIGATSTAPIGFRFEGSEGDAINLNFERTDGNLNLGLVVLSESNQVAYMAALVNSTTMTTTFTLPASGEYTVGVFRLDLMPPAAPERTQFTLTVSQG